MGWEEMAEAIGHSQPEAVMRQERAVVPGTSGLWCVAVVRIPSTRIHAAAKQS